MIEFLKSKKWGYYVPILYWLPRYPIKQSLFQDIFSSITVSLLLIPQSLSYAISLCKLPAVYGLYGSIFSTFIYGILGTSRQLAVGPEALICLLIGNAVIGESDMEHRIQKVMTLSLLVGIFTLGLGLFRMGFMDSVLSPSLLRGFVTAVAFVIFIEQLPILLGLDPKPFHEIESPIGKLVEMISYLKQTNSITLVLSLVSIIFLFTMGFLKNYIGKKLEQEQLLQSDEEYHLQTEETALLENRVTQYRKKLVPWHLKLLLYLPEILIIVSFMILLSYFLDLEHTRHVEVLGSAAFETGFRASILPDVSLSTLKQLILPSILISILGFVEATIASKHFSQLHLYPISANRELVAFGAINVIGSFLNAFPAFASLARSHLANSTGTTSQLSSLIVSFFLVITLLWILPLFAPLPKCVMGSIVCVAASGLLEWEEVRFWFSLGAWWELLGLLAVFIVTLGWRVEVGIALVIGMSLGRVVKESTRVKMSVLCKLPEDETQPDQFVDKEESSRYIPLNELYAARPPQSMPTSPTLEIPSLLAQPILIVKIEESLHFANMSQLMERLRRAELYGGWIHTHPSEESWRPIRSATKNPQISNTNQKEEALPSSSITDPNQHSNTHLRAIIFDIENMPTIDSNALLSLRHIISAYYLRQITVCFVKLRESAKTEFIKSGILGDMVPSALFFRRISEAERYLKDLWLVEEGETPHVGEGYSTYSVL